MIIYEQPDVCTYSVVEVPLLRQPVAPKHERPIQERVVARDAPRNVERNGLRPRHTAPPRPSVGSQAAQRLDQFGRPLGHDRDAELEVSDLELPRGSKVLKLANLGRATPERLFCIPDAKAAEALLAAPEGSLAQAGGLLERQVAAWAVAS